MFGIEIHMCRATMDIIRIYDLRSYHGESVQVPFEDMAKPGAEFVVSHDEIKTSELLLPPSADVIIYDDGDTIRVTGNKIEDVFRYGLAHAVLTTIDNLLANGSNEEVRDFAQFVKTQWTALSGALTPRGVCRVVQFYCDPFAYR